MLLLLESVWEDCLDLNSRIFYCFAKHKA